MRCFTCILDPHGHGLSDAVRRDYERLPRARGLAWRWWTTARWAVLTSWDDPYGSDLVVMNGPHMAVGTVRLDNRRDLERWADCEHGALTDLQLVLQVIVKHGARYIGQFLGDYAFVVWNGVTSVAVAACDAFAVRKLYYAERADVMAFASRAEMLALNEQYEVRYLAELLTRHVPPQDMSVYSGVRQVPAAHLAIRDHAHLRLHRYWSAVESAATPSCAMSEQAAVDECRSLLGESIRLRVDPVAGTWAELSGGLDSSSVVSLAQWLVEQGQMPKGLSGTLSFVGVQGTGTDERRYSDAVARKWQVRNEKIVSPPTWHDAEYDPPHLDQPSFDLSCYPRDRRMCAAVRADDSRVLLTGWGGDELFTNNMLFFADWIAEGHIWSAVREMARRAAIGRVSFWELAYKNAFLPLLPARIQRRLVRDDTPVPAWLNRSTLAQHGVDADQGALAGDFAGPVGAKYRHAVVARVVDLPGAITQGLVADALDVRHPMLYRPLVDFALRLPPALRGRPHAHRWIVREAMRGILPEVIRTRVGKGGTGEILAESLAANSARLASLLTAPILADIGIVDADALRAAYAAVSYNTKPEEYSHGAVMAVLAVEAWLQMRSGRWPNGERQGSTRSNGKCVGTVVQ